jgi:hypothetical protein
MWIDFFKPLLILTTISTFISLSFGKDGYSMLKLFILSTIVQIVIDKAYKQFLILKAEKIKNERIQEFSKQGMEVTCPCYMEKRMFIPIDLNEVNSFNCIECKKDCIVQITAKTFNKTDILDLDQADAALIEVYKKIQESP